MATTDSILSGATQSLQLMNSMVDQGLTNEQIISKLPIPAEERQKYETYLNSYRTKGNTAYQEQLEKNRTALQSGESPSCNSCVGALSSISGIGTPTNLNASTIGDIGAPTVAPAPTVPAIGDMGTPTVAPAPTVPTMGDVGVPTVTQAPEYEKSPEQLAWEEMYSGQLKNWVESGGYGIPEETQKQMIQRTIDALKAKEAEDIRVMRNNMERRGLTNSGFIFSNEQKIRANTTVAIANSITDIQIQSALMKMASFERALGEVGEYLGYIAEESQRAYQPKLATWTAQQQANMAAYEAQKQAQLAQYQAQVQSTMAAYEAQQQANMAAYEAQKQAKLTQYQAQFATNMAAYEAQQQANMAQYQAQFQAKMTAYEAQVQMKLAQFQAQQQAQLAQYAAQVEMQKMQIAQAYEQQNMRLAAQLSSQAAYQQFQWEKELTQMRIDADERIAQYQGKGQLVGLGISSIF